MERTGKSAQKMWSRWASVGIAAFGAAGSFSTAIDKSQVSYIIGGIGFLLFAIAWFRQPIEFTQPLGQKYRLLLQGQHQLQTDQVACVCLMAGAVLISFSTLFRWLS